MKDKLFSCFFHVAILLISIQSNWFSAVLGNSSISFMQQTISLVSKSTYQTDPTIIYLPLISVGSSAYYVSPQGNDSNPGTFSLPWKSIKKAANSVIPGDRVIIRGGIYNEYVIISRSGTQSQPIQLIAYPGETPVLDGQNSIPNTEDGLLTIHGNWVEVSGLEVRNSHYIGIALYGNHNTLTNVFVHHNWRNGIYLNGDYSTVQDSWVWRNSMHSENGVDAGSSGIAASRDEKDGITDYAVIRRNTVWENWGQGINVHHANFVYIEDNTVYDNYTANIYIHDLTNVVCQRNFIYMTPENIYMGDNGPEVGILMGEEYYPPIAKNIQVINNIAYGNHRNLFWYTGDMGGGMTDVLFANNTFVNGSGGPSGGNCNVILDPAINVNVRFVNNIVEQDNELPVIYTIANNGIQFSHNLWSKSPISAAKGTGDVIANPQFTRTGQPYAIDWFLLTASSPAIDAGLLLSEVTNDYLNNLRGVSPDIGAIEYTP